MPVGPGLDSLADPFRIACHAYRERGWTGVIPLPAQQKHPPPKGWTGRNAGYPDDAQIAAWLGDPKHAGANIGLHLGPTTGTAFEVVGVDVDDYGEKRGGQELKELEAEHGELPKTWISTSRALPSGIRFFRVPAGFAFIGKAAPGIDIIQRAHRYAVVWPSWNPDSAARYLWLSPDGVEVADVDALPNVDDLALLPEAWLEFLTRGGMPDTGPAKIDMRSTNAEIEAWVTATLTAEGQPCERMQKTTDKWLTAIDAEESSHNQITGAHWELVHLATEGHTGLRAAVDAVGDAYVKDTLRRGKRTVDQLRGEVTRSYQGSVRKAKALLGSYRAPQCPCAPKLTNLTDDDDRPSWLPVDVAAALSGLTAPPPSVLARMDGACLFYRGKVHSVHGESESGKSWLVQCAAAECLTTGEPVLYIDFEDDAGPVAQRLVRLGVPPELLTNPDVFAYVRPESPPTRGTEFEAFADLLSNTFTLAVVDGVTDAMGLFGLSTKDADDVAKWHRQLPKALAHHTGAAVVCIDHVAKDSQTRGRFALGSQHKMAGLSGAAYVVEMEQPFAVGQAGTASIRVGKDRPGQVRRLGGSWRKSDRTQDIATFHLDSTDPERTAWRLEVPDDAGSPTEVDSANPGSGVRKFRPTWFMEQVSRYWESTDDSAQRTSNKTEKAMCEQRKAADKPAQRDRWRDAIKLLVDEGYARVDEGARGSSIHIVVKPYRADEDPLSDSYSEVSEEQIRNFSVKLRTASGEPEIRAKS